VGQVSRPYQILLASVAVLFALWFVALRPKPVKAPAAPAQPASATTGTHDSLGGLGRAVDAANGAAQTSAQANAAVGADQATQGTGTATNTQGSAPTATKKLPSTVAGVAVAGADQAGALLVPVKTVDLTKPLKATLPADAQRALDKGKVLVLLFWNGKSSDDRSVHGAVKSLSTHGGKVFKDVSRLSAIGNYSAVTNGVPVLGSPTVIVVGKRKQAVSFTGFVDKTNIDQAVRLALGA
jgi:hypothetical protein